MPEYYQPVTLSYDQAFPLYGNTGLTKREYFAAMAMQGMLANHAMIDTLIGSNNAEILANCAVCAADALIKKLNE